MEDSFELIVLDVMLPDKKGFTVLKASAASPDSSSDAHRQGEEFDRILGLELGADDYMAEPFSPVSRQNYGHSSQVRLAVR